MPYGGGTSGWKFSGKVNWDKVSVEGPKAIAAGLYRAKVEKAEPKVSKTDKPMIEVKLKVTGTEEQALREYVGSSFFDNWMIGEEGGFRLKNFALVGEVDPPATVGYDDVKKF